MKKILFIGFGIDPQRTEAVAINTAKHISILEKAGFEVCVFNIGYQNDLLNTGVNFFDALLKRKRTLSFLTQYIEQESFTHICDVFVLPLSSKIFTSPLKKRFPHITFLKEIHNVPGASKRIHSETLIRLIANNQFIYDQLFSIFDKLYTNSLDIASHPQISYIPTPIAVHDDFSIIDRAKPLSICYLGHPLQKKGINEFFSLFELLPKEIKANIQFSFAFSSVGPRELITQKLTDAAKSHKIKISFTESITAAKFFRKNDIYILPIHDHFGAVSTPNTVLESMEAGAVVIVTKLPSLEGVIKDLKTGLFLEVPSAAEILKQLAVVLSNSKLRNKIRTSARQVIMSRYEESVVKRNFVRLYE